MFLDVADETYIGHFFDPRYQIFLFEKNGVSAVDLVANTCASRPSSLAKNFLQVYFSSLFMRWRYSWAGTVIG